MFTKRTTPVLRCVSKPVKIQSRGFAKEITIHEYCADQTKRFDYENYLVGLFFPPASRRAFFAVRALNIELANVKGLVKDPMLGKMRLQFWKDTFKDIYKNQPPEQPVAKALAEAVVNFKLSKTWFNKMIDQRDHDLTTDSFRSLEDLETYAENTSGCLTYLSLECLGIKNINADHAASHIGKALGIAVLLRGTAYHSSKRHCYLPLELMSKHGVSQEKLYRGENSKELQEVIYETASVAKLHLDHARTLASTVPKDAFPALNSASIADHILDGLQKADFNVFDPRVVQKPTLLPVKLLYNKIMGKF